MVVAAIIGVIRGVIFILSKPRGTNSMRGGHESKGQIIELDDYEILDDTQDRASEGYKVKIFDGDN